MQHETRAQQARARLAEITVERHEHEARLSALRKAREDATPVEPVDGVLAWTLRIMLLVLVVGPSAIFMAVKDVPLVANLAMNGALAALILFVPKGALGPVRGDMPPETAEMRAEREVLRSLEREAENLYDD
ncbi:MAG TPA: hypothetical protein VF407_23785, partial [Polyangiaceae bacterium]